jgi:hypothetical protein
MTQPQGKEYKKDGTDDESLASTSRALTPPPQKQPLVKDPGDSLQGGLKKHKMVHVPPNKKKSTASRKCSLFSTQRKKGNQFYVFGLRSGTLQNSVSVHITQRKITEQVCKHLT